MMSGFPRVSETFALGELTALADAGRLAGIFATKPGDLSALQPEAEPLLSHLRVLGDTSAREQAAEVAEFLAGRDVWGIHGYFAHRPAEVAAEAARQLGVPYSFGAHALDARKVATEALRARADGAACVIACNDDTADTLRAAGANVTLLPHGVDLGRFHAGEARTTGALRLLAVGRLVEKKGFTVLIEAIARLTHPVSLRIVGEGPEREEIERRVAALGLADRIELVGRRTHDDLPAEFRWADAVVVPSIVDSRGDRDGLPNVVLEALASGRPVVASDAGAIAAAVRDGVSGLLVPPGAPKALAAAIDRLAADPAMRERLGRTGRSLVADEYDRDRQTARFIATLERAYA